MSTQVEIPVSNSPGFGSTDELRVAKINRRIDNLPVWGLRRPVYLVLAACYLLAFYDITVIGATLPRIIADMHLSAGSAGLPITSNLIGYVVGSYLLSTIADRFGRRTALGICVAVLFVGAILTALSWNLTTLTIFRFISGLGIGAEISLAATIIGEFAPYLKRGQYSAMGIMWAAFGNILTYVVAIGLLRLPGTVGWRVMFAIPALLIFVFFAFRESLLPESPRWLAVHGQLDRAERIVGVLEEHVTRRTGRPVPPFEGGAELQGERQIQHGFATVELFAGEYRGRLISMFCFWFFIYIAMYSFLGLGPTLLHGLGINIPNAIDITAVGFIGAVVGAVCQPFIADFVERKHILASGTVAFIVGFALLALTHGVAQTIIGTFFVSAGIFLIVVPGYTYTAEIFPTRARASALGITDGWGHLGGAIAPLIVLPLMAATNARIAWAALIIPTVIALIIAILAQRTNRHTLTNLAH